MGDKLEPDIYNEFMQIIDSEADRLMNLVNEVLELSKLEEADKELEMDDYGSATGCRVHDQGI
jgi:signal transduction histidine kinase